MFINWQLRELNLKIVYYGPAQSGKTTNLEQIHKRVAPAHRSELVSLKTHEDRTLFFDFLQIELGKISGLTPKIHLYTVPGQVSYAASRRLVLRGVDGVVFVADSAPELQQANRISWDSLNEHLMSFNLSMSGLPLVVQCNKQDLPNALASQEIRVTLRSNGSTLLPAVALRGEGVFDTLKTITRDVIAQVQQQIA